MIYLDWNTNKYEQQVCRGQAQQEQVSYIPRPGERQNDYNDQRIPGNSQQSNDDVECYTGYQFIQR